MNDDLLEFANDAAEGSGSVASRAAAGQRWKLLIVDDEPEIHDVTTLALQGLNIAGRKLEFIHAYSGEEAKKILSEQLDIAVVLLDVVMETDHAGLKVVRHVREELGNKFVRIILRTGQPGQAPEHKVITEFDINDYKHKTELTREKLFTAVYTSISSYRDLVALDSSRRGLRKIIEASSTIFELQSLDAFAQGVLEQLAALLFLGNNAVVVQADGVAAAQLQETINVLAGIGEFSSCVGAEVGNALKGEDLRRVEAAMDKHESVYDPDFICAYYETASGLRNVLYVAGSGKLLEPDRELIELFCSSVAVAHENLQLFNANK